jgi:hypothetical protein
MEWLYLESLVALLILVLIVWWTMRPGPSARAPDEPQPPTRAGKD